jgi:hypothetical protein
MMALWMSACSASISPAQNAINITARVLVEADKLYAPYYEQARIEARESSSSWEERDAKLEDWDRVANLLIESYRWLGAAESLVDTWESCAMDQKCQLLKTMGCLLHQVIALQEGFEKLGIEFPKEMKTVSATLVSIIGNRADLNCELPNE